MPPAHRDQGLAGGEGIEVEIEGVVARRVAQAADDATPGAAARDLLDPGG
jgi:hypothetical protein